ncbi:hypothetical protein [Streptomyces virginiae]|uniref:hypothetical protein n=1 Tax=Streptomyces virginiae TaxID=1961 RepID=UPI00345653D7
MATAVERLKELLGEPACWGWARPRLWEAAEEHLGVRLPAERGPRAVIPARRGQGAADA